MLLIDSFICTNEPSKLKQALLDFINGKDIKISKYKKSTFKNTQIPLYHGHNVLTNTVEYPKNKLPDRRLNLRAIIKSLPVGYKIENRYGYVCEILPNQTIDN